MTTLTTVVLNLHTPITPAFPEWTGYAVQHWLLSELEKVDADLVSTIKNTNQPSPYTENSFSFVDSSHS